MFVTNLKKAVLLGILMWFLIFFAGALIMNILGQKMIGISLIFIGPLLSVPIAYWYLKTTPNLNMVIEGLKLGITWAILAFILDLFIMVILFGFGMDYYTSWTYG